MIMIFDIVPVYNIELYLFAYLNSILDQSFIDFEIICIGDASSNSLEILNYFAKNNSLIIIIQNETNRCRGYSRNHGLENSKDNYISFIDGDNFLS